ncbi:ABC transporter permease [Leptospira sp. WS39.C2]
MIHIYIYFLIGYLRNNYGKVFFNVLSISLGIALFVSTQINGWKAEKSLIDQTLGFKSENIIGRYVSLSKEERQDKFFLKTLHELMPPEIQLEPELQVIGYTNLINQQSVSIPIIGRDLIFPNNTSEISTKQMIPRYFFSISLLKKFEKDQLPITINICNKQIFIKKDEIIPVSNDGLFIFTDIERLQSICNLRDVYSTINLSNQFENEIKLNKLPTLLPKEKWIFESKKQIIERAGVALGSLKINLTIISLVSVLISFFMVSNIYTGIFLSRKLDFGILLSIGGTRFNNFLLFITLALILGLVGGLFGVYLGILISNLNIFQTLNTITDANQIETYKNFPPEIILFGLSLSILGSVTSAIYNAIKVYNILPVEFLKDKIESTETPILKLKIHTKLFASIFLIFSGILIGNVRLEKEIIPGLVGVGLVILGFILLNFISIPYLIRFIFFLLRKSNTSPSFIIGLKEIQLESWKNGLTISTIMLSTSLVFTLSSLTNSYESSLKKWIDEENTSDYSLINEKKLNSGEPGVSTDLLDVLRDTNIFSEIEPFFINSKFIVNQKYFTLHALNFSKNYNKNEVIVSKNLCFLEKICKGNSIKFSSEKKGEVIIKVQAEKEHFFSERGTILMDYTLYKSLYPIDSLNSIRLTLLNQKKTAESLSIIKNIANKYDLIYLDQKDLKGLYLAGLNRVFSVLDTLKLTAIIISILSLSTSIFYYVKEKSRILAGLKAMGMSFKQLYFLLFHQTSFLLVFGIISGVFNSLILSPIVVFGINQNAFGWDLTFSYPVHFVAILPILILVYATFITLIPFYFVYRMKISKELNYE